jgi:CPA2 family monovalent cation:H+ antiporter-2
MGDHSQARLQSVMVGPSAACIGRTLESLNLAGMQVQVTAVRRQGVRETNPASGARLREGDIVVLMGTQEALAKAEMRLLQG